MVLAVLIPASVVVAFLLGAIPWSLIIGKRFYGVDLRREGSGNLGATNTYRVLGMRAGLSAACLDVAKGSAAVGIAWALVPPTLGASVHGWTLVAAALAAVLGHSYSPYIGFAGGKGVATAAGALLVMTPKAVPFLLLTWLLVLVLTRYVSLGSVIIAAEYPFLVVWLYPESLAFSILSLGIAAILIWRHRSNLRRLVRGEETRLKVQRGGYTRLRRP